MSARRRSAHGGIRAGAVPAAEPEVDGDVVTVDYRFSILAVRRFVDKLSDEQEEVVRSMGFEGVLHLSRYSKLDRHFSAWLCNQLAVATAPASASVPARVPISLADGAGAEVPVTARDVHEVLGVPNSDRQVGRIGRALAEKERDADAVRRALCLDPGEALTLQAAEAIVARRNKDAPSPTGPMTQAERDAFAVAFLLLLVEHFFAPGSVSRRGKVNEEVFHALANPSEVHLYDWAEYALEEFRRCAGRVREQVTSKSSKIALSGCLLFLEIFYLDRLDFGEASCGVQRGVLPRVAAYDYKSLYQLIEMERQPEWPEGGLKLFGKIKFSTVKPAQRDDFRSTSEGRPPPPHLQSCDDMHLGARGRLANLNVMSTRAYNISKDAAESNDAIADESYPGNTAFRVQSGSNPNNTSVNLRPTIQQEVPSKKRSRSDFHIKKGTQWASYNVMTQVASPSSEKKSTTQVTSCQTTSDSSEDVTILETNPFKSSTAIWAQSRSGPCVFPNLQPRTKREVPSEHPVRNGACCESYHGMIQGASHSSENKPVIRSFQTISDRGKDGVILDSDPFDSSTVGSAPRVHSRSNPEKVFANLHPEIQQKVAPEERSQSELLTRKDTQCESYNDMIQQASPSSEKKPVVEMTSCQTASDSSEDVVILDTDPFKSSTVSFDGQNSAPWAQLRSNPKEKFSNLPQEAPSKKRDRTEFQVRRGTQCDSYHDKTKATSACPEETPVVQTTLKDVMTLEPETGCAPSCRSTETKKEYIFGPSPFEMGLVHPEPPLKEAEACFKWLEACSYADDQLKWPWIVLEEPIPIKVEGLYVKLGMIRAGELKADVCNLVMRLYHQLDDQIYQDSSTDEPRWRHFLPAEWSSSALKHGDKICESSATVRTMFSGQHITYDVGLCRMIIAPVEVEGSWSCYAWDFKEKRLNILEPLRNRNSSNEESIKMKHSKSAPLLLRALLSCVSRYCSSHGYDHQESSTDGWETRILQDLKGMHTIHKHNTGMYVLFNAREFDGKGLKQTVGPRTIASLRRDLMYQMLTMRGNTGRPPSIISCPVTGPVRNQ